MSWQTLLVVMKFVPARIFALFNVFATRASILKPTLPLVNVQKTSPTMSNIRAVTMRQNLSNFGEKYLALISGPPSAKKV